MSDPKKSSPQAKPEKPKKEKKPKDPIVYSKVQTLRQNGEEVLIELTEKDLDWTQDPLLRQLFLLDIEVPDDYAGIRAVRALRQYVAACVDKIDQDYQASRKLGRIKGV